MQVCAKFEIRESVFELSGTQVKTYGGGATEVKPVYPRLLSGVYIIMNQNWSLHCDKYISNGHLHNACQPLL